MVVALCLVGVGLTRTVGAQDTNTLLNTWLRNLRAGQLLLGTAAPQIGVTTDVPLNFMNNTSTTVWTIDDVNGNLCGSTAYSLCPNGATIDLGGTTRPFGRGYFTEGLHFSGTNGQVFELLTLTELTTIAAAATTDTTIQMPAGAVVYAVSVRVTTVIPTAATFTVGDSGSAARFSTAAVTTAAGGTDAGTKAGAYYNASALSIRITPDVQPAANTGRVRVTMYYYLVTPPTS